MQKRTAMMLLAFLYRITTAADRCCLLAGLSWATPRAAQGGPASWFSPEIFTPESGLRAMWFNFV
jgi:hypothetical protein